MIYLTIGEQPSGIYEGQVIDVCAFIKKELQTDIRLVAFISIRNYFKNKNIIKSKQANAIVLPMWPRLANWRLNAFFLILACLLSGSNSAICRNVIATNLALMLKKWGFLKKVCFDGRGAIAAEWTEYNVVKNTKLIAEISKLEKQAIHESDFRIAVSKKLIEYWSRQYGYNAVDHVVIPCTLSTHFSLRMPIESQIHELKKKLGFKENDIILIYSGSSAGWQSFELLRSSLIPLLVSSRIKVIFLSKTDENLISLQNSFPSQILIKWVKPNLVQQYLHIADYGILIREDSVTNQVAAPTKFAEYLASGNSILISPNIGDYTEFVEKHACGITIDRLPQMLENVAFTEKLRLNTLAEKFFTKTSDSIKIKYAKLVKEMK